MAWKASCVMDERMKFIGDCLAEEWSMAEVCRRHGVSRRIGYKWLHRYRSEGVEGLEDRSRAPHARPSRVDGETEEAVVALKRKHMTWGPKKLRADLAKRFPSRLWPAASTIGALLDRHGLVVHRRKRNKATPSARPLAHCQEPNAVWSVDFKGWFRTGDGTRCDPLTLSDGHTRFILCCQALSDKTGFAKVRPLMETAFREFGLPSAIRSDNGTPFASVALAGLSHLAVWWIRLGIIPERIRPGKPQDNGRHERMHRTLKEATANPPQRTLRAQQRAFDRFVQEYNYERPHEALDQNTPASVYEPSLRPYPSRLPAAASYPDGWAVRKVKNSGRIKWNGHAIGVCTPLTGEYIGLQPIGDGIWKLYFGTYPLGIFEEKRLRIRPLRP